jgi:hypothetical protein
LPEKFFAVKPPVPAAARLFDGAAAMDLRSERGT